MSHNFTTEVNNTLYLVAGVPGSGWDILEGDILSLKLVIWKQKLYEGLNLLIL